MNTVQPIIVVLAISALFGAVRARAQQPQFHLADSPDSRIVLGPAAGPASSALTGQFANLAPISFSFKNLGKPILAVVITYKVVDLEGRTANGRVVHSGYNNLQLPTVVPSNSQVVMAFSQMLHGTPSSTQQFTRAAQADQKRVLQYASIDAQVDCVIFSDGEVVGPDTSGYVQELAASRTAASAILSLVKGRAEDQSIPDVLSGIVSGTPNFFDKVEVWKKRYANQIVMSPTPNGTINYLASLPAGPTLFKTSNGGNQ